MKFPSCLHTSINSYSEASSTLLPSDLSHSTGYQLCANMYLCAYVWGGLYRHLTAPGTAQVMCFIKRKSCHSESPFLLKAVRDKITSYLRPKQDILEVSNGKRHKRHSISGLHSGVTPYVRTVPHSQGW